MGRLSRDAMFLSIAMVVAQRGTCDRASVGAVLVRNDNHNIVAIGYNGAAPGEPHCDEVGHNLKEGHCTTAVHAEVNCLNKATSDELKSVPLTLYVTHYPCAGCVVRIAKALADGLLLTKIVYAHDYGYESNFVREHTLKTLGVRVVRGGYCEVSSSR